MSETIDINKADPELADFYMKDPLLHLLIRRGSTPEQIILALAKRHREDTETAIEASLKCTCNIKPVVRQS